MTQLDDQFMQLLKTYRITSIKVQDYRTAETIDVALTYNINYKKDALMEESDYEFFEERLRKHYGAEIVRKEFEKGKQGRLHCHYKIRIQKEWMKDENKLKTFHGSFHPVYGKGYTFKAKRIFDDIGWETYISKMKA